MTIQEYEEQYYDELVDNYKGKPAWHVYVNRCYQEKLDSIAEMELDMELNNA